MAYGYQLLRYVTNPLGNEFVNIAAIVTDPAGGVIDARFTPDFRRLRCQPLADMELLEQLKTEFEEVHLAGEGFPEYVAQLTECLSNTLSLSPVSRVVTDFSLEEMERIERTYLATAPAPDAGEPERESSGSRTAIRRVVADAFARHHLLDAAGRVQSALTIQYGGPRFRYTFDFGYQPNGTSKYVHALGLRNDASEAERLVAVIGKIRMRDGESVGLTTVLPMGFPEDTEDFLEESGVKTCLVSNVESLAISVREDLGL